MLNNADSEKNKQKRQQNNMIYDLEAVSSKAGAA